MQIEIDDSKFRAATEKLKNKILVKTAIQAANRTIGNMKSEATRYLREDIKIKARDKDRIFKTIAANIANNALAQLFVTPQPVPLIYLKPRVRKVDTSRGTRQAVSVVFNGQRKVIRSGFLAELKSGHRGIFKRIGDTRVPIKELFSWIGQDVFKNRNTLLDDLQAYGEFKFRSHFISGFDFFVEKELGKDVVKK